MPEAPDIAQKVRESFGAGDDSAVIESLRNNPNAGAILEQLSDDPDAEVRGWVPDAARQILGTKAVPLIARMTTDSDADIRSMALDALEELDPELLTPFLASMYRMLRSQDDSEVISAAWKLIARGDEQAANPIAEFRDRYEPWMWQSKAADVMLTALKSPEDIPRRIRAHDHEHMTWLANAAIVVETPDSLRALRDCVDNSPDEACRRVCAHALALSIGRSPGG